MKNILCEIDTSKVIGNFEEQIRSEQVRISGEFSQAIKKQMEEKELSHTDVAWTLGKKRPYVSRALNAEINMTLKSMVEIAHAVGLRVELKLSVSDKTNKKSSTSSIHHNISKFETWETIAERANQNDNSITDQIEFLYEVGKCYGI